MIFIFTFKLSLQCIFRRTANELVQENIYLRFIEFENSKKGNANAHSEAAFHKISYGTIISGLLRTSSTLTASQIEKHCK